jgi:hypothetical protein
LNDPAPVLVALSLVTELEIAELEAIDWEAESVAADEVESGTVTEVLLADADDSESEAETSPTLPLLEAT